MGWEGVMYMFISLVYVLGHPEFIKGRCQKHPEGGRVPQTCGQRLQSPDPPKNAEMGP